jgi:predicted nucleic acid-binding protein
VTRGAVYVDSSAVVKLIFDEDETQPLERFLANRPLRFCSVVGRVEVMRLARSVDDDLVVSHAHDVLRGIHLVEVDARTIRRAIDVDPRTLRALDAIHLATALSLDPDLEGMVVYDTRLSDAARAAGLTVWAPA